MVRCRHPQSCHKAAWYAEADVGAARRNPVPYRGHRDVSRADAPPKARWATPNRMGLSSVKRRGGCRADSCGHAATGEPPGIHDAEPWRVTLQRGRGRSLPGRADQSRRWQSRRAETGLPAAVGYRHAAAAAWDGKRKGVTRHSRSTAAAPPVSRSEATDRPPQLSYPTPAPGPRDADPGRGRSSFAPARTGAVQSVAAQSVRRCTRPSRSSGPAAGRTGRCAGRPLPHGRC